MQKVAQVSSVLFLFLLLIAVVLLFSPGQRGGNKVWIATLLSPQVFAALIAATIGSTFTAWHARSLEVVKQAYSRDNQANQQIISENLKRFEFKMQQEFAQFRASSENEAKYVMLRRSVLDTAQALLPRIVEILRGLNPDGHVAPWSPEKMTVDDPESNKRDTTMFRMFRFFGAYRRYRRITDWEHPIAHDPLIFFFEEKIEPVFASGGYSPSTKEGTVIWRETITQLGLLMIDSTLDKSRPDLLDWLSFCQLLKDQDPRGEFLRAQCRRVSRFLAAPYERQNHSAVRLALLGVYLYDLCATCEPARKARLKGLREQCLAHILDHTAPDDSLFLYDHGNKGLTDLQRLRQTYSKKIISDEAPPVRFFTKDGQLTRDSFERA